MKRGGSKTLKLPSFEAMYPTKTARDQADEVLARLPIFTTTIAEMIRAWDHAYLSAGGIVKGLPAKGG